MHPFFPEGPIWFVAFMFSLTCHEAAHAAAAMLGGDRTAYYSGQVSLNPLPHIKREPLGMVFIPLFTYMAQGWMIGWASAPYDPSWQHRYPKRAAWMALAGPAANFTIVFIVGAILIVGLQQGFFVPPEQLSFSRLVDIAGANDSHGFAVFLSVLFSLNLVLGVFNLIPVPPLDGATVLGLFVSDEMAVTIYDTIRQPGFQIVGLLISWRVFENIFPTVFYYAIGVIY